MVEYKCGLVVTGTATILTLRSKDEKKPNFFTSIREINTDNETININIAIYAVMNYFDTQSKLHGSGVKALDEGIPYTILVWLDKDTKYHIELIDFNKINARIDEIKKDNGDDTKYRTKFLGAYEFEEGLFTEATFTRIDPSFPYTRSIEDFIININESVLCCLI